VSQDIRAYFEELVIPLVAERHPEVASEMIIQVTGSAGLGFYDQWSDLDAFIFLPHDLWREHGGQLQLTLVHSLPSYSPRSVPHCECPGDPFSWPVWGHPEINVHPWSELLCGRAEDVLDGKAEVPWEEVGIEELFGLQEYPVLRDPRGVLARLREVTAPQRYPECLWRKRLIEELAALKGEPWDLEKAALRQRALEAEMILGPMLSGLFHIGFLISRQYYPWRKYLLPYFRKLPGAVLDAVPEFEVVGSDADWPSKAAAISRVIHMLTGQMMETGILTAEMLEYLFDARGGRAWVNPDWRSASDAGRIKAKAAGYDWLDGWIWNWWEME
jgi:hypothetical protein